jgi:hypothetical protein
MRGITPEAVLAAIAEHYLGAAGTHADWVRRRPGLAGAA